MTTLDIWNISAEEGKDNNSDQPLKSGQKVRITRQVTYVYERDMTDVLAEWDAEYISENGDITVKEFVTDETENGDDFHSIGTIEEDLVVSVELL